jgi:2-polyprenyl-3-methyl-5-hydroxy-6-metoxy-1,4-benzoquinol methylase
MLNNLVNRHDAMRVYRKATKGDLRAMADKLRGSAEDRVVRQWSDTVPEPTQWWSIPEVRQRWNRFVSGDADVDFPAFAAERYLAGRSGLRALSLGCGMGGRELRWADLGVFDQIDAYDIAPSAVEVAALRAREEGLGDAIEFRVGDIMSLELEHEYDVVLAEHSLHHLAPMPDVVAKIDGLLGTDGLFLVDEFVGARRFQWTTRQLDEAQHVLDQFPERYRQMGSRGVKNAVQRPSRLWMLLTDPSEAIDSARITPTLHDRFDVLEELPYGGAVLHLALADIAQNFLDADDVPAKELLAQAFQVEDDLMASGAVGSDFAAFVCRKREGARK